MQLNLLKSIHEYCAHTLSHLILPGMNLGRDGVDTLCNLVKDGRLETIDISYSKMLP